MNKIRVLFGLISEKPHADGSTALSRKLITALRQYVDLSIVMMPAFYGVEKPGTYSDIDGPQVQECVWEGLPAIVLRPRTNLSYDLDGGGNITPEIAEGRYFSQSIADFAYRQSADLFHITSWHFTKSVIFEAAVLSGKPFVFTPYDCVAVCKQIFLRQHDKRFCTGPDRHGRKCLLCLNRVDGIRAFWRSGLRKRALITFSGLGTLLGSEYPPQWDIVERFKSIRKYLAKASRILPMSVQWASELNRHLKLPEKRYTVCKYGLLDMHMPNKCRKEGNLKYPLKIGYLQRISDESGAFFILEAWRRARLAPSQAVLHMFATPGDRKKIDNSAYGYLLKTGSVQIYEDRIADKMDEIIAELSAVVVGYQMKFLGFSGSAYEAVARGIPVIAPEWKSTMPGSEDAMIDGLNAIKYCNFDANSLAKALRRCTDSTVLEALSATCVLPPEYQRDAFIQKYLQAYNEILIN